VKSSVEIMEILEAFDLTGGLRAAAALAGWEGRETAGVDDVRRVAPLALAHRSRRGPFDPPVLPPDALEEAIEQALDAPDPPESGSPDEDQTDRDGTESSPSPRERPLDVGASRRLPVHDRPRSVPSARGRVTGDAPAGPNDTIAIVPTARMLATGSSRDDPGALRTSVRHAHPRRTVVLCVDLSGSMGARARAEAASGTVLGLLSSAYERRDKVALVTFRGDGAEVVLSPTGSVEVARHRVDSLVTGGETPLAAGLTTALDVARKARAPDGDLLIAVLTDGRATGAPDALDRAIEAAAAIRRERISAIVLDCESGATRLGLARQLAEAMGAQIVTVDPSASGDVAAALG